MEYRNSIIGDKEMSNENREIVIVHFCSGQTSAYYRHDPELLCILIHEHDHIEEIITAELYNVKDKNNES